MTGVLKNFYQSRYYKKAYNIYVCFIPDSFVDM